jgi:hypothetical protein
MGPIDYTQEVQTPFQSTLQGYAGAAQVRNDQQQQAAMLAQQAAAQRQQQLLTSLASNPKATADDYASVMTQIPSLSEHLGRAWSAKNTAQQQAQASDLLQWGSALKQGRPEVVVDMLNRRADAMEASGGQTPESKALRIHAQTVEAHPEFALGQIQAMLSANPNGKDAANTLAAFGTEKRAEDVAPVDLETKRAEAKIKGADATTALEKNVWDIANVKSQIGDRSSRLGLDRDKLTTDTQLKLTELQQKFGELPEFVAKDVNAAATEAMAAEQSAKKMIDLADRLEKEGGGFGALSTAGEWIKRATGNQNEMTRMRAEYNRMVTPSAMAAYKQVASGSTSDKDIETAMTGVPKDTADAATMAAYLRGVAKLQAYDAVLNNAKSEWLGAVRNLGKSKTDVEIDGVKVPAGTTFKNFSDSYLKRKVGERTSAETIAKSPYAQFAQPVQPAQPAGATPMQSVLPVTGGM